MEQAAWVAKTTVLKRPMRHWLEFFLVIPVVITVVNNVCKNHLDARDEMWRADKIYTMLSVTNLIASQNIENTIAVNVQQLLILLLFVHLIIR